MQGDGVSEQSIKVYDRTDRDIAFAGIRMAPGFSRPVRRIRKQLRERAKIGLDRGIEDGVGSFVHDRYALLGRASNASLRAEVERNWSNFLAQLGRAKGRFSTGISGYSGLPACLLGLCYPYLKRPRNSSSGMTIALLR